MSSHCENIWHPSTFISSPLRTFDTRTHPWDIELEVVTIRARSLFTVHCHCSPCSSRSLFTLHSSLFTLHCCMRITHIVHFVHHVFWHTLGHPRALREMPQAYACVHATPTPHAQNTVHHHSVVFQRTCTQLPRHCLRRPGTKQKLTQHEFDNFCLTRWAVNVLGRHATRWTMNVLGNIFCFSTWRKTLRSSHHPYLQHWVLPTCTHLRSPIFAVSHKIKWKATNIFLHRHMACSHWSATAWCRCKQPLHNFHHIFTRITWS